MTLGSFQELCCWARHCLCGVTLKDKMVQTVLFPKKYFLIEVEMHMEEPEEHTPHPSLSLAADRSLVQCGRPRAPAWRG